MSHGPSASEIRAEPNLTPLLDVVLQLIMFFVLVVEFKRTSEIIQGVDLPESQVAVPMDKSVTQVVFLNLDKNGTLIVPGGEFKEIAGDKMQALTDPGAQGKQGPVKFSSPAKIKAYLQREKENADRLAALRGGKGGENIIVVLRADKGAKYRDVFQVLHLCKEVGFPKIQQRAMQVIRKG
jgi:biopolymer transport protein ExbD